MTSHEIEDLISEYRNTAIAWDVMQKDSCKANPLFKRLHVIFKQLRHHPAGREAISALMSDATLSAGARLVAASHSLGWEPERAIAELERIERERSRTPPHHRQVHAEVVQGRHSKARLVTVGSRLCVGNRVTMKGIDHRFVRGPSGLPV